MIDLMELGNEYCVYINYSEVSGDGTIEKMTPDEVDKYYEKKRRKQCEMALYNVLGIENMDVSASVTKTDIEYSSTGVLRQILVLTQGTKGGKIYVQYSATWLEEPWYRGTDACTVAFKNASIDDKTIKCYYECKITDYYTSRLTGQYESHTVEYKYDVDDYGSIYCLAGGVAAEFELDGSRLGIITLAATMGRDRYYDDKVYMNFYVTIDEEKSWKYIIATGDYWHQESSATINPSFSYSSDGPSFSIAPSISDDYNRISNNTYIKFYFK